jgi:hypothetical protein
MAVDRMSLAEQRVYWNAMRFLRSGSRGIWASAAIAAALYATVLLSSAFLHHDLSCHLKDPTHCVACTANPSALRAEANSALGAMRLRDAGRLETTTRIVTRTLFAVETPGRSPPA